jgi:ribonuclease R
MPRPPEPFTPDHWRRAIIQYIAAHPDRPLKSKALARELGLAGEQYAHFRALVRDLLDDGTLALGAARTLRLPELNGALRGVFRAGRAGNGFIELPGRPDLYVPRTRAGSALDGDTVLARVVRGRGRNEPPCAEVVRVVQRAEHRWVGVLEPAGGRWVVQPRGRTAAPPVFIDDPTAKGARAGEMVVVEPLGHTLRGGPVRGVIVERLGPPDSTQAKILGVIRRLRLPDRFPPEVRGEAQHAAASFDPQIRDGREDLSELLTITIDPADARDYDDAISIEPLPRGHTRLGVHIADVAHFVRPDTALDREARLRGNSVYFPGYVVPMLPETLSNGVCSLQPGQPRFALSVFLDYDAEGRVIETRFTRSLIRSAARLTYEQVTAALAVDAAVSGVNGVGAAVLTLLRRAERLARRIRERRLADGMISLSLEEVDIRLDERGRVVDAQPADASFSHTIIEMFMVEANEAVCRLLTKSGYPHLRRVHPPPDPQAGRSLSRLLGALQLELPARMDRRDIQALLERVRGKPPEPAVNFLLLRSLARAYYSPSHEAHFALASEDYCHFTSPIRRYPDLLVHRALAACLPLTQRPGRRVKGRENGHPKRRGPLTGRSGRAAAAAGLESIELEELGRHASATERLAQQAERELRTLLLLELMKRKMGEVLDGITTGVASFGVFVQVRPYLAEGLVRLSDAPRDDWDFDPTRALLRGRRSGRIVTIGQPIRVQVAGVDEIRQELLLVPAEGRPLGVPVAGGMFHAASRRGRRFGAAR